MHVNNAIHPIAIASKTGPGQHGSSAVSQQVNRIFIRLDTIVSNADLP